MDYTCMFMDELSRYSNLSHGVYDELIQRCRCKVFDITIACYHSVKLPARIEIEFFIYSKEIGT